MTTTAEFVANISAEVRRGTSLDTHILRKLKQAIRWMEELHTFLHMENFVEVAIDSSAVNPRRIAIPTGFKTMDFWRISQNISGDSVGAFVYLNQLNPRDQISVDVDCPTGYWQSGASYFWLDNAPDQDYSSEMSYQAYTTLPSDTGESPSILQNFEGVLLHKTCTLMAPLMRDKDFRVFHAEELKLAITAAIDADVEARQANQDQSVIYGSQYSHQIALNRN